MELKKTMKRNNAFRHITRHAGKGNRDSLKRTHESNEENVIVKTYVDRKSIESKLIEHNKNHFKQAHQSIAFKDKTYKKLKDDDVRNRVLKGEIEESECDDKRMYKFLKLLKTQRRRHVSRSEEGVTVKIWRKVVKQSKKRSESSIFSKRTHSTCKCA